MDKKKGLIIGIVLLALLALGLIIYVVLNKDSNNNNEVENTNNENEDVVELSEEKQELFDLLLSYGTEIYESEGYLNLEKDEDGVYYATKKDLVDLGYDMSQILEECEEDAAIIFFDVDHVMLAEYSAEPIQIVIECYVPQAEE